MNHLIRTCKCHWLEDAYLHWGRAAERETFVPPGTTPKYPPDAPLMGRHMRLELHFDLARERCWGVTTHELETRAPLVEEARFNAVGLEIEEVKLDGKAVPFDYSGEAVTVAFPKPAKRGQVMRIALKHAVERPRAGLYFTNPDKAYPRRFRTCWSQGQDEDSCYYFPCLDAPNFKQSTEALLYVPKGLFALSNGERIAHKRGATKTEDLWHYKLDLPYSTYLFSVVVGDFREHREKPDRVEVRWYVQRGREKEGRNAFGATGRILAFLSAFTGHPYPHSQYTQIAVPDFVFGGMENFTATTQTDLTLHDLRAHLDFSSDDLVTHEAAHTWFGNLVTARSWSHAWLHESFATYMEALYKRETLGVDEYDYTLLQDAEAYQREDGLYRRPIVTNRYEFPIDLFDAHLYPGGAVRLRHLHAILGEVGFREAVKRFLAQHRLGLAETVDFARVVETVAGKNHDEWFAQWIETGGYPNLEVSYSWQAEKRIAELRITQKEPMGTGAVTANGANGKPEKAWFKVPLTVAFHTGRTTQRFPLMVEGEESRVLLPLAAKPEMVLLDPDFECPVLSVKFEKPQDVLLHELEHAPRAVARIRAADALAEKPSTRVVNALRAQLKRDPFWGAQQRIARAIGRIGGDAARDALIAALNATHPKARRVVVEALGWFRNDPVAAEALEKMARKGDRSYYVEAELARALGKANTPKALPLLKTMLRKPSHIEVIRAGAYDGLAELGLREGYALCAAGARYGAPEMGRAAAIAAAARLAQIHPDLRKPCLELLQGIAEHKDNPAGTFRGKLAALRALLRLGDLAALESLQRVQESEADGRIVRLARVTAERLRKQADKPQEMQSLRDDLDKVVRENKSLRERMDSLEPETAKKKPAPRKARKR